MRKGKFIILLCCNSILMTLVIMLHNGPSAVPSKFISTSTQSDYELNIFNVNLKGNENLNVNQLDEYSESFLFNHKDMLTNKNIENLSLDSKKILFDGIKQLLLQKSLKNSESHLFQNNILTESFEKETLLLQNTEPTISFEERKNERGSISSINKKYSICYSVFGRKYWHRNKNLTIDLLNEIKASKFYFNWTIRFFHDGIPQFIQKSLTKMYPNLQFHNVKEIKQLDLSLIHSSITNISNKNGRAWRFLPMGFLNTDVMCSRDLDSPLLEREEDAVNMWLKSDKIFHVMRDNPEHIGEILGGTWCFRNSKNRILGQIIVEIIFSKLESRSLLKEAGKYNDQAVLNKYMWPLVSKDVMQHDSYLCEINPGSVPFPTKRKGFCFVGGWRDCDSISKCPLECRPKDHPSWDYC